MNWCVCVFVSPPKLTSKQELACYQDDLVGCLSQDRAAAVFVLTTFSRLVRDSRLSKNNKKERKKEIERKAAESQSTIS